MQRHIAFPVIGVRIHDYAFHGGGGIVVSSAGSEVTAVIKRNDYLAPIRVQQHFGRIEAKPPRWVERSMSTISIALSRLQSRYEDMPVVVRAIDRWIELND